jgi:P-type Ca2+ transporter type 2C
MPTDTIRYHTLTPEAALSQLASDRLQGLSREEALTRLAQYGKNALPEKKRKTALTIFLLQFKDFMIGVLLFAAVVSGFLGEWVDTVIIVVIIILNALIGFVQEYRAGEAMDALKKMSEVQSLVLRGGQAFHVPAAELVPGDIVLLEAGDAVPADLRLLEAHQLRANESALTGESVPVDKQTNALDNPDLLPADRSNLAFRGSTITYGRGRGLVVATGTRTELGQIASLLQEDEGDTPLKQRMQAFGKRLSYLILLICLILFVSGLMRGEGAWEMLLLSISLAVAAIPEALPALITIALARGARRMVRKNALIRQLPAVETLGSVTYICSDKTGTLTMNQMRVSQALPAIAQDDARPEWLLSLLLNHDAHRSEAGEWTGDPTETAIVKAAAAVPGVDPQAVSARYPRCCELPFDADRKCMTTAHAYGEGYLLITKGAAESLAGRLADRAEGDRLLAQADTWAGEGLRVLAYGYRFCDRLPEPFSSEEVEKELQLAGMVGLIDPPREEVAAAIEECKKAGIRPVMITGDHPATALAIARQIGIATSEAELLSGRALDALEEGAFLQQVEKIKVYARVTPAQKLRIVNAIQSKGHFVAMTGDGVNDAPSLKAANIGIAMGITGTDVSKEAAHMILLDDNFATIIKAVREGRRIYDNIRKFVKYIMTCNSAEIWTILLAPLLGLPIPLLPIHILWINLVTDGLPGLALSGEKAETDIMRRPPRPAKETLFAQGMGYHIAWVGLFMAGITLGIQSWSIHAANAHWQTMVFTVLALAQLAHVLAIRGERSFLFRQGIFSNLPLLGSVLLAAALQLAIIYLPGLNTIFRTQPLSLSELLVCIGAAAVLFHAVEFEKWLRLRKEARPPAYHG